MAEREVRIRFTGEAAVLKGALGDVRSMFQALEADSDDARGSAEKLAAAYTATADKMRQRMRDLEDTASVLADSLGPELAQAIEQSGRGIVGQIEQWERLGLSLDDIKRDSDQLAAGLRNLDDVSRQSSGQIGDGFRKVAGEADNTRSVVANFAGNALQELPGVAGAFGPLNMAIGQFAEYAAEGNISLSNFAKAAGPLAGASLLIWQVASAVQEYQRRLEQAQEAQEAFRDGNFEEAAQKLYDAYEELFTAAAELGVSSDTVTRAILGEQAAMDELIRAQTDYRLSGGQLTDLKAGLAEAATNAQQAWTAETAAAERAETVTDQLAASLERASGSTASATEATDALARAEREAADQRRAAVDSVFALHRAQDGYTESLERLAGAADDPATGVNELRQAQDAAAQAAISLAEAQGGDLVTNLRVIAGMLAPGDPLRANLEAYADQLAGVPSSVSTSVSTPGALDAAERMGFIRDAAREIPESAEVATDAPDAKTTQERIDDIRVAVEEVPDGKTITFRVVGLPATLSDLDRLESALREVITLADRADRAVARVAG